MAGVRDLTGEDRKQERDRGKGLAGKSTLNRLELSGEKVDKQERYHKIVMQPEAIDRLLVEVFLEAHANAPTEIVLDLDATDNPLYGQQEGRFFHGYYGHYCYLPLYIFRASTCCAPGSARPTSMPQPAAWTKSSGS